MINLLPPKEKGKLLAEKRKKMIVILWFLIFFFIVCLISVLFAIKIRFNSQLQLQQAFSSADRDETKQEKVRIYREKIKSINLKLQKAESFYKNKIYFSDLLEKISLTLLEDIYLNDLSITFVPGRIIKDKEGKEIIEKDRMKVSLQGFAPSRESLFEFKNKLEEKNNFINVSFPASNWVKAIDIDFSVSFEIEIDP